MAALLIIAHAPLASALLAAARHTYAESCGCVCVIDVEPDIAASDLEIQVRQTLQDLLPRDPAKRQEILVLCDVFGATPCNVALRCIEGLSARCVTGANVPMLWRTMNYLHEPLDSLVGRAIAGGTQGVIQVNSSRPQNQTYSNASNDHPQRHHQQ